MPVRIPVRAPGFRRASRPLTPARRASRRAMLLALAAYTLGFAAVTLAHAWPFLREGRYFIYGGDGYTAHFPIFCYLLDYWREYLRGLATGQWMPKLFDFSLGLGGDVWALLQDYGMMNPFCLLALPVPQQYRPHAFSLLMVLQFYLAGLGFYAFCRKLGRPRAGAVAGAWVYLFTGFYVLSAEHPLMVTAVFYLPLLLLECEKLLRRESPLPLALTVFCMALTGFYFLFICSVALAFYVLLRVWAMGQKPWWRAALTGALRSLAAYLAGLCMACPIFLPALLAYFDSDRSGTASLPALLPSLPALREFWQGLADPARVWSLGAFGLLAAVLLLAAPRASRPWPLIAGFGIAALFALSPLAQGALVGFGETADTRFWFVLQFLAGFAAASCWPAPGPAPDTPDAPDVPDAPAAPDAPDTPAAAAPAQDAPDTPAAAKAAPVSRSLTRPQLLTGCAFAALCALLCAAGGGQAQRAWMGFLVTDLMLLTAVSSKGLWGRAPKIARFVRPACGAALAALVLAQPALALFANAEARSPAYRNERFVRQMPPVTADTLPEGEYRVDASDIALHRWWAAGNAPLVGRYKGLSAYLSVLSRHYAAAMLHDWALLPAQQCGYSFQSLDGCMALDTLASVRYTFIRPGEEGYVPYGFAFVGETPQAPVFTFVPENGATLHRYENLHALPLGYAYSAALSAEQVASLNALQKQAAMLSAVALADSEVPAGFAAEPAVDGVFSLPSSWQAGGGAAWQDGTLTAAADSEESGLTLRFTLPEDAEVHLCLSGLVVESNALTSHLFFALDPTGPDSFAREVYPYAVDPDASWVNLGYAAAGEHTVQITLASGGRFALRDITVWGYSTASYDAAADALGETVLQNVVVGQNSVAGLLQTDSDCILGLSIPWSSGWRATIDGARAVPRRANSMFMALEVPAGEHVIGLYYITPGLKAGLILCALGVLALAAQLWWYYYKKRGGGSKRAAPRTPRP